MKWRPIETAPKCTRIIVGWTPRVPEIATSGLVLESWRSSEGHFLDHAGSKLSPPPTHWMPLPEAPK